LRERAPRVRDARGLAGAGFAVETAGGRHEVVERLEHGQSFDAVVVELPQRLQHLKAGVWVERPPVRCPVCRVADWRAI